MSNFSVEFRNRERIREENEEEMEIGRDDGDGFSDGDDGG